ncbi:DUF3240 family protein [Rugamonas sp. CCM 8940]|uniref:DUF3240 family protein n=1 Tax=Rugamonas sp. CCM 8940 TaxID=2765359 RepID=UPI0018F7BD99|nr:DUF3240 family protein [Rugamonas sp. CCM 8940]MBJ7310040.1 DUF3240 family protein [Rugamonas sp. CCM 8940]
MSNDKIYDAMLTLAIPVSLEEDVLDFLLLRPAWAGGFSVVDAQGMGRGASLQSTMEKVQGRSRRKLVLIAGVQADLRSLLDELAGEIRNPDVAYWMAPLLDFGRLA